MANSKNCGGKNSSQNKASNSSKNSTKNSTSNSTSNNVKTQSAGFSDNTERRDGPGGN